jgi:hypothetical protein
MTEQEFTPIVEIPASGDSSDLDDIKRAIDISLISLSSFFGALGALYAAYTATKLGGIGRLRWIRLGSGAWWFLAIMLFPISMMLSLGLAMGIGALMGFPIATTAARWGIRNRKRLMRRGATP